MYGAVNCSVILHSPVLSGISVRNFQKCVRRTSNILKIPLPYGAPCVHLQESIRQYAKFVRTPVRAYFPEGDGIVSARGSWAKLPKMKVEKTDTVQDSKSPGQIFKSVMGDIYTTKNKRLIAVEGARQVDDAISFGLKLKKLFLLKTLQTYPDNVTKVLTENDKTQKLHPSAAQISSSSGPEVHLIGLDILQEWSSLKTPPGIIGIFEKPTQNYVRYDNPMKARFKKLSLLTVIDNIREPGNLGSILRTAAGIGCEVLLSRGCVDPWDTKSLRGGNGAQFLVPMTTSVDIQFLHQYIPFPEYPNGDENSTEKCHKESGGVAVVLADSGTDIDKYGIPIVDYTSIQYSKFDFILLILGGETTGLRETLRKVAKDLPNYYSDIKLVTRISIPMSLPIDSLNVANAFGIIGYEIFRQCNI